jgi:hypothetical protein
MSATLENLFTPDTDDTDGMDDIQATFADASIKPAREEREYFIARTSDKVCAMIVQAQCLGAAVEVSPHTSTGKERWVTLIGVRGVMFPTHGKAYIAYGADKSLSLDLIGAARRRNPRYKG